MDNASARNMWGDFLDAHLEFAFVNAPNVIHFRDNESDANKCVELVKKGVKKATSNSLLGLQYRKETLPKIGDFIVVTNWEGQAQCIVRLTRVSFKPYFNIDHDFARLEGEGDRSLDYWKRVHWNHYIKELEPFGRVPRESMIIVCQEFEKVF